MVSAIEMRNWQEGGRERASRGRWRAVEVAAPFQSSREVGGWSRKRRERERRQPEASGGLARLPCYCQFSFKPGGGALALCLLLNRSKGFDPCFIFFWFSSCEVGNCDFTISLFFFQFSVEVATLLKIKK